MSDSALRTNLDRLFVSEKKKLSFPYLYLPQYGEEVALLVKCLEPGPLSLVLHDGGVLKQIGACACSALTLAKLLRVYSFEVVLSETERRTIRQITDVLEVLPWMVSL